MDLKEIARYLMMVCFELHFKNKCVSNGVGEDRQAGAHNRQTDNVYVND